MVKTDLTAQRLRELLHYDPETGVFTRKVTTGQNRWKAGEVAGSSNPDGYWEIRIGRSLHKAHRLAWLYVHGQWPADLLDHVDGNPANNRIANLREASIATNAQNVRAAHHDSTTGLLGVSFDKNRKRWQARICVDSKSKFLGRFATPAEAHAAYLAAKHQRHPFSTI